jgi:hypothetical protein
MALKLSRFVAFLFVALVLGAGLTHLFTMPGKMVLSGEAYLTVQQLYSDWVLLNVVLVCALLSLGTLAWQLRPARWPLSNRYAASTRRSSRRTGRRRAFALTLLALLAIVGDTTVTWSLAHEANRATANWTFLPANWQALRAQWEYAHAAAAALDLLAFAALVLSVLVAEKPTRYRDPDESSGGRGAPLSFMAVR